MKTMKIVMEPEKGQSFEDCCVKAVQTVLEHKKTSWVTVEFEFDGETYNVNFVNVMLACKLVKEKK